MEAGGKMHPEWIRCSLRHRNVVTTECIGYTVPELLKLVYKFVTNIPVIWLPVFTSKVKIIFRNPEGFIKTVYLLILSIRRYCILVYIHNSLCHYFENISVAIELLSTHFTFLFNFAGGEKMKVWMQLVLNSDVGNLSHFYSLYPYLLFK